ncbi:hypothetical protein [Burkholderia glumae]|uniref:hypothetical protein n=1 Tax=Burkholderia glumae TaxID=337 RepID=UPI00148ED643|nr:hypothetical protein [Burkholderia glumae]QJW82556.1 hypothetical protein GAS18_28455 [Burkholderia glumae]
MRPDPKIRAFPRPVRIAYLLEAGEDSQRWLDAIFAECFGRHGGRQSLIVPVADCVISERYRDWLRVLDPDVIVTLTYDNDAMVSTLVELLPDTTIFQRKRQRDNVEMRPRMRLDPAGLTALSWLPFLKANSGPLRSAPDLILDCYPAWEDDGFITDNFGTLHGSMDQFPIHSQLDEFVRGLLLTPADAPEDRWNFRCVNTEEAQDGYEVVERMARDGRVVTLGHLSNLYCQPHRPDHPWTEGFCLVVGDSFEDRLSCWNAGLLFDDAHGQVYKTLRVPAAIRSDEVRTRRIGSFLRSTNWLGPQHGPRRIIVRSRSLGASDLDDFVKWLSEATMAVAGFEAISSIDDCCPPDTQRVYRAYHLGGPAPVMAEAGVRDATTTVVVPKPTPLAYCVGLNPLFSQGHWYLDLSVDRLADTGRYQNVREVWQLPMRTQLVPMFCERKNARLLRDGELAVRVNADTQTIEVKQPDDSDVFASIFAGRPQFLYPDMRESLQQSTAYEYSAPSDKGRYLQGVLGMLGSLDDAARVFGSHFWRAVFHKMAAPAEGQVQEVIRKLKKRLIGKAGRLEVESDDDWERMAKSVIALRGMRSPRYTTKLAHLEMDWEAELRAACDTYQNLGESREAILQDGPRMLKRSLAMLCEVGVFHRGHEWVCRHCSHRNWAAVDALRGMLSCAVCRRDHALPIDLHLDFRLNEFISTCVREHDTLTMVWALSELQRQARRSFIFAPQTALFRSYPERPRQPPDRELDIVCVVDGKLTLGEAKSSVAMISATEIATLAEVANELTPDVVVLAARTGDQRKLDEKVRDLQGLIPAHIEARGLLSDWNEEPSVYLP